MSTHSVAEENANTANSLTGAVAKLALEITIGSAFGLHMADLNSISTASRIIYRGLKGHGKHRKSSVYSTTKQDMR